MKRFLVWICCCFVMICVVSTEATSSVQLKKTDVQILKNVFSLHRQGQYKKASEQAKKIQNPVLNGYVLFHKYMSARYNTKKSEIEQWLKKYGDLAVAPELYALAKRKNMSLKTPKPKDVLYGGQSKACSYIRRDEPIDLIRKRTFSELSGEKQKKARQSFKKLRQYIVKGETLNAKKLIESRDFQSLHQDKDMALAHTVLAFSYFLDGQFGLSLSQAEKAIGRDALSTPLAYWTAGLASWQLENYRKAAQYFSQTVSHADIYPLLRSSSAFWAARSFLKTGSYDKVGDLLDIASQQPDTLYGMLAMHMLGMPISSIWNRHLIIQKQKSIRFSHPALNRFYTLKQIGQDEWATKELTKLYLESEDKTKKKLLHISQKHGFENELIDLAGVSGHKNERFPLPQWKPINGWQLDKALVYAYVRQESCFNPSAKSAVGARGVMQIMPATGQYMAQKNNMKWSLSRMENVSYNLSLGQYYLEYLMKLPVVSDNLIYLAVAYNGGPGNLTKWKRQIKQTTDPLMFIESIPSRETRSFVERIMVNYWVYRSLTGQSFSTMDDIIAGRWPLYVP